MRNGVRQRPIDSPFVILIYFVIRTLTHSSFRHYETSFANHFLAAVLAVTAVSPVLYTVGQIACPPTKLVMLVATMVWFATVPFWMGRQKVDDELVI